LGSPAATRENNSENVGGQGRDGAIADASEKIKDGASLVQPCTALVYQGPGAIDDVGSAHH
jgi:dihydroorotate dehydrogenase